MVKRRFVLPRSKLKTSELIKTTKLFHHKSGLGRQGYSRGRAEGGVAAVGHCLGKAHYSIHHAFVHSS